MQYLGLLVDDGVNGLQLIARYDDSMPGWQFQPATIPRGRLQRRRQEGPLRLQRRRLVNPLPRHAALDGHAASASSGDTTPRCQAGRCRQATTTTSATSPATAARTCTSSTEPTGPFPTSGMLRSNGTSPVDVTRYDGTMPGWQMRSRRPALRRRLQRRRQGRPVRLQRARTGRSHTSACCVERARALKMASATTATSPAGRCEERPPLDRRRQRRRQGATYSSTTARTGAPEYLGTMVSDGSGLQASWREDWVGEWNLGAVDRFEPCDYEGVGRPPRPHRPQPGLARDDPGDTRHCRCSASTIRWIHNYRYGRNW